MTLYLPASLRTWGTPEFESTLKQEVARLDATQLPLQQGLTTSSYALADKLKVSVIRVTEEARFVRVKAGLFYTGIIAGCSCADDPTPVDEVTEYCEVQIDMDKTTAKATISLLA